MPTVLLLTVLLTGADPATQSWSQFRGPNHNGHALATAQPPTEWSETKNVAWKIEIHDKGWSSPVIWGDQIWMTTGTADGKELFVVCVNKNDGSVIFDKKIFDIETPQEIHATNSHASPTPVIEDGRVYVHFGAYGTACLDTKTAEVLWTRQDLKCNHWRGPGSSPVLYKDLLFLHYDGFDVQYVVALDKKTGETVWKKDRDIDFGTDNGDIMKAFCTPLIIEVDGQPQLVSPASKACLVYDPQTGDEIWRVRYKSFSSTGMPIYDGNLVYINTGFGKADLVAVKPTGKGDVTDTHVVWTQKKSIGSKPSQLLVDGLIYNVHDGGVASCIEAQSGDVVWQERLGGSFSGSPIYAGGNIYFMDEEGTTTVVKPGRKFEKVAENKLDIGLKSTAAIDGDAIILRTKTHLYRLEAK